MILHKNVEHKYFSLALKKFVKKCVDVSLNTHDFLLCFRKYRVNPRQLKVRFNAIKGSPKIPVGSMHLHFSYEARQAVEFTYYSGDVAILRLIDPADVDLLHTVCLPYDMSTLNERDCYVTGRGYLDKTSKQGNILAIHMCIIIILC